MLIQPRAFKAVPPVSDAPAMVDQHLPGSTAVDLSAEMLGTMMQPRAFKPELPVFDALGMAGQHLPGSTAADPAETVGASRPESILPKVSTLTACSDFSRPRTDDFARGWDARAARFRALAALPAVITTVWVLDVLDAWA